MADNEVERTGRLLLYSYSQVGRMLNLDRRAVTALVRALKLVPKPVPTNGRAKGLNDADVKRIKKALGLLRVA
jgi:hypothetical protein